MQRITFQFVGIVEFKEQFRVGSIEDEPSLRSKMRKYSTSTRLLKTLGRMESFMIAFSRQTLLKKVYRE